MKKNKNEENIIEINKNNYKGYVQLFKIQHFLIKEQSECQYKFYRNMFFTMFCAIGTMIITIAISEIFVFPMLIVFIIHISMSVFLTEKKILKIQKERCQILREKYSYVDTEIKKEDLEKSLEKVGLVQYEHKNEMCLVTLKVKEYEDYLKMEEIKEDYLQETKYDNVEIDPKITEEDLRNKKVKVKSLVR